MTKNVFVSSVRRGLEEERDALPGFLKAIGHEPLRFEDFSARPTPSRQACLDGVDAADVYMLLLGAHYGQALPETGQAPTEEELTRARTRGIQILVFRKSGVEMDEAQRAFVERVESYDSGWFRGSYRTTHELQTRLAEALRGLPAESKLTWISLSSSPAVPWVSNSERGHSFGGSRSIVELHAIPMRADRLSATVLFDLSPKLANSGRAHGLFEQSGALSSHSDHEAASAATDDSYGQAAAGLRITRSATVSVWQPLPTDGLGVLIDPSDLQERFSPMLRLVAEVLPAQPDTQVALAVALAGVGMASEGSIADLGRRSSASFGTGLGTKDSEIIRVPPQSSVPVSALVPGATEIARELVAELVPRFRASR